MCQESNLWKIGSGDENELSRNKKSSGGHRESLEIFLHKMYTNKT